MQIMVFAVVLIAIIAFIIYKVNNKFETKEFIILFAVIVVSILATVMLLRNEQERVPLKFKEKYEQVKNVKVLKFSYERLNNKTLSSKTSFVYNFDYIINKDNSEYFCTAKNVKIKKIEDEYIFENIDNLEEKCLKK